MNQIMGDGATFTEILTRCWDLEKKQLSSVVVLNPPLIQNAYDKK